MQLWNAEMSMSSNHTNAFVQCCHGKHTVTSSLTLLSDHVSRQFFLILEMFEENFSRIKKQILFIYSEKAAVFYIM